MVNCVASQTSYNLIQTFTTEGTVPQNWYVCNGKLKRVGGGLPYTSGCRLLHFTNETKAFEYGLMVQNPGGNEKAAWARFGDNAARSHMTLHTGHYALRSRVCNWDQPNLSPVIYTIEDLNGNEVASKTFMPAKNIGGNTANRFTSGKGQTFEFYIPETGDYVFTIYTDAVKDADFVLGMATLDVNDFSETGIQELDMMNNDDMPSKEGCFDLSGRKITERMLSNGQLKPGIYIIDGRKIVIQ